MSGGIQKRDAFDLARLRAKSKRNAYVRKPLKPLFEIVMCRHQQGEKANQLSGNMMLNFRSSYEKKDTAAEQLSPFFLTEKPKWNAEKKYFSVRVFSIEQAQKILNTLHQLEGKDAGDLPKTIKMTTELEQAKIPFINIISHEDMWMLDNDTFPLKEHLKDMGFTFDSINSGFRIWQISQERMSLATIKTFLEQWGWKYTVYDESIDTEAL